MMKPDDPPQRQSQPPSAPSDAVEQQQQQHHQQQQQQQHQDPEALVRAETRLIDFLRCLVIGLLVVVATSMAIGTFKVSRRWELDSFYNNFEGLATRITQVFLDETSTKLWYGT